MTKLVMSNTNESTSFSRVEYDMATVKDVKHDRAENLYSESDILGNAMIPSESILIIYLKNGERATFGSNWLMSFEDDGEAMPEQLKQEPGLISVEMMSERRSQSRSFKSYEEFIESWNFFYSGGDDDTESMDKFEEVITALRVLHHHEASVELVRNGLILKFTWKRPGW